MCLFKFLFSKNVGKGECGTLFLLPIILFPIYLQGQSMNMVQMEDLFEPLDSGGEYIEEPWDPRPQRVRPPSVGNRGSISIPTRSFNYLPGRPDLDHSRSKLRTGPRKPSKRKITPLPSNHPCVTNRKYDPATRKVLYVPSRLDYDHQTDLAIAELDRLIDIRRRNGRNEFLSKLIKEAEKKIEESKKNAVAAGNFYVNGVHFEDFYAKKSFPKPEDFLVKSYIPEG